jgi:hypothetical protein
MLKPGPQGYQVATVKQFKPDNFFSDDFRVSL